MAATVAALDVGTTAVKLLLVDGASERRIRRLRRDVAGKLRPRPGWYELQPLALLGVVRSLFADAADDLGSVRDLLLCGQMHGIVLWRSDNAFLCTNCVTWQDQRCDDEFLGSLPPVSDSACTQPKSGFGLATLAWWQRHSPQLVAAYDRCGSVADWLCSCLAGAEAPMSEQMAASWGYFDTRRRRWDAPALAAAGLPTASAADDDGGGGLRLPDVVEAGSVVGRVSANAGVVGLGADCRIRVALGDLQCAVYAACRRSSPAGVGAFVNFGTSAQLGFVCERPDAWLSAPVANDGLECFPYFCRGRRLLLAASLNGGNVLDAFVQLLADWTEQLGGDGVATDAIWRRLEALAEECESDANDADVGPTVEPRLFGERHCPRQLGSVLQLSPGNCRHLGRVYASLCRGLVANLLSMCPQRLLLEAGGVDCVSLAGGLLLRSRALEAACRRLLAPLPCRRAVDDDSEDNEDCDAVDGLVGQFVDYRLADAASARCPCGGCVAAASGHDATGQACDLETVG